MAGMNMATRSAAGVLVKIFDLRIIKEDTSILMWIDFSPTPNGAHIFRPEVATRFNVRVEGNEPPIWTTPI